MCKPMMAEFSKRRDDSRIIPTNFNLDTKPAETEPLKIRTVLRRFLGPFTEKYEINLPRWKNGMTLEEYENTKLGKIDPTHNYFNEYALCDVIITQEDKKKLEECTNHYKFENFVWTYKYVNIYNKKKT